MPTQKLHVKKTSLDKVAHDRITAHEVECAKRYEQITEKMDAILNRVEKLSKTHAWIGGGLALLFVLFNLGLIDLSDYARINHGQAMAAVGDK